MLLVQSRPIVRRRKKFNSEKKSFESFTCLEMNAGEVVEEAIKNRDRKANAS